MLEVLSTRASLDKFMHACYGLSLPRKLWVMGYEGIMGYVGDFPASQLGRWDFLWVMGGYGLREVWVIRVSTVIDSFCRRYRISGVVKFASSTGSESVGP